jgi:hypothetical protein
VARSCCKQGHFAAALTAAPKTQSVGFRPEANGSHCAKGKGRG